MARTKTGLCSILLLVLVALSAQVTAQKDKAKESAHSANQPEAIWRDPGKMASLNLFYGAGGKRHAPDPKGTFTFVKEDMEATSPKFDVEDRQGIQWRVKLGEEPESETAATRLRFPAGRKISPSWRRCSRRGSPPNAG